MEQHKARFLDDKEWLASKDDGNVLFMMGSGPTTIRNKDRMIVIRETIGMSKSCLARPEKSR